MQHDVRLLAILLRMYVARFYLHVYSELATIAQLATYAAIVQSLLISLQ